MGRQKFSPTPHLVFFRPTLIYYFGSRVIGIKLKFKWVKEIRLVIAELDGSAVDGVGACAHAQAHDDDEVVAGACVDGVIESF